MHYAVFNQPFSTVEVAYIDLFICNFTGKKKQLDHSLNANAAKPIKASCICISLSINMAKFYLFWFLG
jgi:hypothetical protein